MHIEMQGLCAVAAYQFLVVCCVDLRTAQTIIRCHVDLAVERQKQEQYIRVCSTELYKNTFLQNDMPWQDMLNR